MEALEASDGCQVLPEVRTLQKKKNMSTRPQCGRAFRRMLLHCYEPKRMDTS